MSETNPTPQAAPEPNSAAETPEEKAADLAEQFEGFSAVPYLDPVGVPTIGYGSTRDDKGQPITMAHPPISQATAREWLVDDLQMAVYDLKAVVSVKLTDNEEAALADFIYNLGIGAFKGSTLLKLLNAGDLAGAADQIDRWNMAGGKEMAGLLRRRQAEQALFNQA